MQKAGKKQNAYSSFCKVLALLSAARRRRGERGVWQRRYWEHLIRDEADYRAHMDYVHINPVKHELRRACERLAVFDVSSAG